MPFVGHSAVEHGHQRAASARRAEALRERPRLGHVDPVGAEEVPLEAEAWIVGHAGRVGAPVRNRVGHVRVLAELGDRLAHRVAVVDRKLLGASRQGLDGLCARLGRHPGGHAAARALVVADDHLVGHVVSRARSGGNEQQQREGG